MQAERDHLVRFVFPRLREELLKHRLHFVDVDLRWGVTGEQDASEVCREIITECRPRFLCMLGGRYGTIPDGKELSVTADEVHFGVLDEHREKTYALFYFRHGAVTEQMDKSKPGAIREPRCSEKARKLARLKRDIRKAKHERFHYRPRWKADEQRLLDLKAFGDRVARDILATIDDEFGPEPPSQLDEFTEESAAMEAFIEERSEGFVLGSRKVVLDELLAHANGTGGNGYICLVGEPGAGKSALLAHFSQDSTLNNQNSTLLIQHFVGASTGSTDKRRTLRRLCHEIYEGCKLGGDKQKQLQIITGDDENARKARLAVEAEYEIPNDPETLRLQFPRFLEKSAGRKRIVIILDAVNQFDAKPQLAGLWWLTEKLPDNVRIILSTLPGSALDELKRRRQPPREVDLKPLTLMSAARIVQAFLHRYHKKMDRKQRRALLSKTAICTPLYLLAALEELRTLGTYEEITDRIAQLPPHTQALFTWILKRLEDDNGFRDASGRKIGPELVPQFTSLMRVSRHGLSQRELAELLAPGDSKAAIPDDAQGNVAALQHLLRPYLMRRGELLDFYHDQFRAAAEKTYLIIKEQRVAAHRQIGAYFQRLACPHIRREWDKATLRALSELPYQRICDNRKRYTEHLLCDLRFIEASISGGLLEQLLGDLDLASQSRMPNLVAVQDAMFSSVSAIRQRPHLALQTIINHLRNEQLGSTLKAYIKRAEALMDKRGLWLRSMTSLGYNRLVQGVVSLSPQRRVFHVLTEQHEIEGHEMDTQLIIERHAPFGAITPFALVIHPVSGQVAWMDSSGIVYDGFTATPFRLRTREHCLSFLGSGLIGIDSKGSLVFFDSKTQSISVLIKSIDRVYATLDTNPDCTMGVVVSGDRLPAQRILLLKAEGNTLLVNEWPALDSPVTSACLDSDSSTVLFVTRGRRLKVFDLQKRKLVREASYRVASGKPVRGIVQHCRMTTYQGHAYAILATTEGELCVWDCCSDIIQKRGRYRGIQQQCCLRALETLPLEGQFVVATEVQIQVLNLAGQEEFEVASPITNCSLSHDGWFVTVNRAAKRVTWFHNNRLYHESIIHNYEPISVAVSSALGVAFVGYSMGSVVKLHPGEEPAVEDAVDLFDRAVVSVVNLDNERVLAACANGQFRIVRFQPIQVLRDIRPVGNIREEEVIRRLGTGDDFVCCGRYHVGDSHWSVVVVRSDDSREAVLETRKIVLDIAANADGLAIFAVVDGKVCRYRRVSTGWIQDSERVADVSHIVACHQDLLGVVLRDNGLSWLELWSTSRTRMETVAAMDLPYQCTSLCSSRESIGIGAVDGRHCLADIREEKLSQARHEIFLEDTS